ncbi:MAG: glycosyltransferase family 9 protein [Bacteroidota bacterium]
MKFLVIQTAFIGDVVLATPVVEKLHRFFPDAAIDILVRKGNERLFDDHPFLNQVLIWDKKNGKTKNLGKLIAKVRSHQYSHVINLHRYWSSGLLAIFSGASEKIGFDKNPLSSFYSKKIRHIFGDKANFIHEVDRNLSLIEHLTDGKTQVPVLYPRPQDFDKIKPTGKYVCIAPASVWTTKQYPLEKWKTFVDTIPNGLSVYLIGGPLDKGLCHAILSESNHPQIVNLAGQLSFLESCALMKNAEMNYVNDSAPTHFASAVNAPVTTIYCSTIPEFGFTPLSDNSIILQTKTTLNCRPCGIHGKKGCPLGHFNCADINITPPAF